MCEPGEGAVAVDQLTVGAGFIDVAVVEDDNPVHAG